MNTNQQKTLHCREHFRVRELTTGLPGAPFLLFPDIIPRMQVFTRLHLLFLNACPKKAIFVLIIWAWSSRIVAVHLICSCLSFSPSNLFAAFFGSTTFQLLLIVFHRLPSFCSVRNDWPYERFHQFHLDFFPNSSIFPNYIQFHGGFLGPSYSCFDVF